MLVVECGERLGASVCGTLLASLGAEVILLERDAAPERPQRAWAAAGKRSLLLRADEHDRALAADLLERADVVLLSSDVSAPPGYERTPEQIVCDVTAFGSTGPLAGRDCSDALVQALSGVADTTGDPKGPPTLIGFPFCEVAAGIYAAAAILVAHRVRRTRGFGQHVEVALFDCAVGALATFLPFHAAGKPVTRSGNRHSLAAPWNAYEAADGWVLICTATDEQWRRLCTLVGRAELSAAPGFATNAERVGRRAEVDEVITDWTRTLAVEQCIERLSAIDIACGPILALDQLRTEPNLLLRGMVRDALDTRTGSTLTFPGVPLPFAARPCAAERIPAPDADRAYASGLVAAAPKRSRTGRGDAQAAPLAGLRVIEIGQYTTAPLVARQLGALGAEVFKLEPPGGEGSRTWPPTQGDRGYFFAFSNSDKRSLELDLRDERDRKVFRALLERADVLVENLKPGSLARLGFDADALQDINPRLVYCGISGFGAQSAYPGRPAFDTVVQAMSGFMDVTRAGGVPMKAGISAADIVGGELGLVAILAALERRDRCGRGGALDISMQDAAVWATASVWHARPTRSPIFAKCADGYVCIDAPDADKLGAVALGEHGARTREQLVAVARAAGLAAAAVLSVSEAATSEQTVARELIIENKTADGRTWPLLNSPMRLTRTPAVVRTAIGELGEANREVKGG